MAHKFIDNIKSLVGKHFILNYDSVIEHKFIYKTKISTQCTKCLNWSMMSVDALKKRLASNNIPHICRKCVVSESMKKPSVRKKCQKNSRSYWRNEIIKASMVKKANNTKFMNRLDQAFED